MLQANEAYIKELIALVNSSPFPSHLPFRLVSLNLDHATVELDIDKPHLQPFGIVHGGVLATLIDTATFWAVFMRLPEDTGLVNIDLKLNYLRTASEGRLIAEGHSLKSGRTISYAESSVRDSQGKLVAHGTSTLMALPGKGIEVGLRKFLNT